MSRREGERMGPGGPALPFPVQHKRTYADTMICPGPSGRVREQRKRVKGGKNYVDAEYLW